MRVGFNAAGHGRRFRLFAGVIVVAAIATALVATGPQELSAADATADPVVATVGDRQIRQSELDAAVLEGLGKSKLYDLRKQALDQMIATYLVDAAAKKENLTPDAYLARGAHQVTEADAQKFYDDHKAEIDTQTKGRPFSEIKPLLISGLQRRDDSQRRDALVAKLRADAGVKEMLVVPRFKVASGGHPWTGGKNAPVTIVEFSDFQCPFCRAAEPVLKQIGAKYGDKVKIVYMDFPLGMHLHAMDAAVAGRCAADQHKFWQLHDAMFSDQTKLDADGLKASAVKAGLDGKKFNACFEAQPGIAGIKADQAQGARLGVNGTPTFFINGREMVGMGSEQGFSDVIDEELARAGASPTEASTH